MHFLAHMLFHPHLVCEQVCTIMHAYYMHMKWHQTVTGNGINCHCTHIFKAHNAVHLLIKVLYAPPPNLDEVTFSHYDGACKNGMKGILHSHNSSEHLLI